LKKIVLSQRIERISGRNELRECVDSEIYKLIWKLGATPIPVSSFIQDTERYLNEIQPDGILLTGGNDIGSEKMRDQSEYALLKYAEKSKLPVFGVCRGMQIINSYFGGAMTRVSNHVGNDHLVKGTLYPNGRMVNSFHDFGITQEMLGEQLNILAQTEDGVIEAIAHCNLPWHAVMWHPERTQATIELDLTLIKSCLTEMSE